jgi:hypothetical protein
MIVPAISDRMPAPIRAKRAVPRYCVPITTAVIPLRIQTMENQRQHRQPGHQFPQADQAP